MATFAVLKNHPGKCVGYHEQSPLFHTGSHCSCSQIWSSFSFVLPQHLCFPLSSHLEHVWWLFACMLVSHKSEFLEDKDCIDLCVLRMVWQRVCIQKYLNECESVTWPHAIAAGLHFTWERFSLFIFHIQVPYHWSLTRSHAYDVMFQKLLLGPWVVCMVSTSPYFPELFTSSFQFLCTCLAIDDKWNLQTHLGNDLSTQVISWGR